MSKMTRFFKCAIWIFLVIFVLGYVALPVLAQDLMCCSHVSGSCRSVCEKISLVDLAASESLRDKTIREVQKYCSVNLVQFWDCLNATFKDISKGSNWSGRYCCHIPNSESCRKVCTTASSRYDLAQGCRQSDEIAFFSCLDRQDKGDTCCSNARTKDCKEACLDIFRSKLSPTEFQRQSVRDICEQSSPAINECIKDFVEVTPVSPQKIAHCCDMSNKSKCRETCKKVVSNETTIQYLLDSLETGGCGPFLLQDFFWQCFFQTPEPQTPSAGGSIIARVGIDSAKWHCCQRASNPQCQRLCSKTFTKSWITYWTDFQMKCLHEVSEENLRNCIDEVDEPCELGCDGLSFCTNFNNRPTELFRSCTSQADEAARNDLSIWQTQNRFSLLGMSLPIKNSSSCSPNIWQAVACTLEIKPCSRHSHATQICRNDCLEILANCVDWSEMDFELSADSICANLSPHDPQMSCISLSDFTVPSESVHLRVTAEVSSPCKGDPCEPDEICVVNNKCANFGPHCKPYKCLPGCKLGDISEYMVPDGTYVRIPIPNNPRGCLKICKCNKGKIEDCQPLLCVTLTPCLLGNRQQLHGSSFDMDCNHCNCFAGEIICSKKQCEISTLSGRNTAYTTLPCNCPPHYVPVCGTNGNSYPSACLAKCAMLSDSNILPCQDPCRGNKCPIGYKCVPNPQVCLSLMHKPCTQFICVNGSTNCHQQPDDPVCDNENKEHPNVCFLAHSNAKFGYKGPCLRNCNPKGQVCGINGKTYNSECASFADYISVDYAGSCVAIGLIGETKTVQCVNVNCKPLPNPNCLGITPPGACCPICGGALRLLYSKKQIDRALYALQDQSTESLTLRAVLKSLERQIQVVQCTLRGYLTVELDIFIIVESTERNPSNIQLETCIREAEKLASLINMQSSRIASELSLSSLMSAKIVHTIDTSSGVNYLSGRFILLMGFVLILVCR